MLISTDTQVIAARVPVKDAVRILAAAGFSAFDFSVFDISAQNPVFGAEYRPYLQEIQSAAAEAGIVCNQAHAPYPTRKADSAENAPYNEKIFDITLRAVEAAAALGAKCVVVHPMHHLPYAENAEYLFSANMDFYRALAPHAKRQGIKIALENMWQRKDGVIVDSTCGAAAEFIRYFDTLADDCFTCCLDLGHTFLCGHDTPQMIRLLGGRIGALHIHDNDGASDAHLLPYHGRIDWDAVLCALSDIGYAGDFTYEAHGFVRPLPTEALADAYRMMASLAATMAARIGG